jgi:hypothetical protein
VFAAFGDLTHEAFTRELLRNELPSRSGLSGFLLGLLFLLWQDNIAEIVLL